MRVVEATLAMTSRRPLRPVHAVRACPQAHQAVPLYRCSLSRARAILKTFNAQSGASLLDWTRLAPVAWFGRSWECTGGVVRRPGVRSCDHGLGRSGQDLTDEVVLRAVPWKLDRYHGVEL
ncbi:hypothetical protein B0H65DRAFT_393578, partial [Neurospora tetraspora]